jgi:hypothetical protein
MGRSRFETLLTLLPPDVTVIGIDEHTALAIDLADGAAEVMGAGDVTVLHPDGARAFAPSGRFSLAEFGPFAWPEPNAGLPPEVWAEAMIHSEAGEPEQPVPEEVLALVAERQAARERRDWAASDALRARIAAQGWGVKDTPDGAQVVPL